MCCLRQKKNFCFVLIREKKIYLKFPFLSFSLCLCVCGKRFWNAKKRIKFETSFIIYYFNSKKSNLNDGCNLSRYFNKRNFHLNLLNKNKKVWKASHWRHANLCARVCLSLLKSFLTFFTSSKKDFWGNIDSQSSLFFE